MSNKAWKRRRYNKSVRMLRRRVLKTFGVKHLILSHQVPRGSFYIASENLFDWNSDYSHLMLPQRMAAMVADPKSFVRIDIV